LQERLVNMNNKSILNKSETDLARLDAMSDEDIDFSDCPEVTPEMFAKAVVRRAPKSQVTITLRVDPDVLAWFESQGDSAERQMAMALKIYSDTH
ncbi:MAG: BrnA antitoxin family protein, partial [Snowella sp.]